MLSVVDQPIWTDDGLSLIISVSSFKMDRIYLFWLLCFGVSFF
jgi:hypothetical protein